MFNKAKYFKANAKKILHKSGKRWVVLTLSALALLTTDAVLSNNAHASIKSSQPVVTKEIHNPQRKTYPVKRPTNKGSNSFKLNSNEVKTVKPSTHMNGQGNQQNLRYTLARHHARRHLRRHYVRRVRKPRAKRVRYYRGNRRYLLTQYNTAYYLTNRQVNQLQHYWNTDMMQDPTSIYQDKYIYGAEPLMHVIKHIKIGNYNLYRIHGHRGLNGDWVLANELSPRRHKLHLGEFNSFAKAQNRRYLNHYINPDNREDLNNLIHKYNYLMKYDNNSDVDMDDYRNEVMNWVNYYRNDLTGDNAPVSLDSDFNDHAQSDVEDNQDPEVMDSSDVPQDAVDDYFTDAWDIDNDGATGHRESLLNPSADYLGVGKAHGKNALYFDWGSNNGASDSQTVNLEWPNGALFPLSDAQTGEYWSYQVYNHPYSNEGGDDLDAPDISVYDEDTKQYLPITNEHTNSYAIYWKVPSNQLHLYHTYDIDVDGYANWDVTMINL